MEYNSYHYKCFGDIRSVMCGVLLLNNNGNLVPIGLM